MIKKLSLFFSAIAIGILTIFGSISTKNTAEPQYFLENIQVKKQFVENPDCNILELDNIYLGSPSFTWLTFSEKQNVYLTSNETPNNTYLVKFDNVTSVSFNAEEIEIEINDGDNYIYIPSTTLNNITYYEYYLKVDKILFSLEFDIYDATRYDQSKAQEIDIAFQELGITNDLDTNLVLPTIEYIPDPIEPDEPIPPLEQINTLVSDIVNWFTNIFNGLGNVFYDPTANKLTAWGTVMFIGVAIMLISMALKWVISLIRGV